MSPFTSLVNHPDALYVANGNYAGQMGSLRGAMGEKIILLIDNKLCKVDMTDVYALT